MSWKARELRSPRCWAHTPWKSIAPDLPLGLESEVAQSGMPSVRKRELRKVEGDVTHLEAPEEVVVAALVKDVDAVGRVELARLIEVHVDVDALRDGAVDLHPEEQVRV